MLTAVTAASLAAGLPESLHLRPRGLPTNTTAAVRARGRGKAVKMTTVADTQTKIPGASENFDFFNWPVTATSQDCVLLGQGPSSISTVASGDGKSLVSVGTNFTELGLVAGSGRAFVGSLHGSKERGCYLAAGVSEWSTLFMEKAAGVPVNHAADAVSPSGDRHVGFVSDDVGVYRWKASEPSTFTQVAGTETKPFPDGGPLNYFSEAPNLAAVGSSVSLAFFASRTQSQPGGARAGLFVHDESGLRLLVDSGESSAFQAFTDPCISVDDTGALFISFVALVDGQKALYVQWADGSDPVRVLGVGDVAHGCGLPVIDFPNVPPSCTNGAITWFAEAGAQQQCSGMYGAAVPRQGKVKPLSSPVATTSATAGGHGLILPPKTGRGSTSRSGSTLTVCLFGVLDDTQGTFGVYRVQHRMK